MSAKLTYFISKQKLIQCAINNIEDQVNAASLMSELSVFELKAN